MHSYSMRQFEEGKVVPSFTKEQETLDARQQLNIQPSGPHTFSQQHHTLSLLFSQHFDILQEALQSQKD
jgi:hypothetical protein